MLAIDCGNEQVAVIMRILVYLVKILQILIPIILIILISYDFFKAMTSQLDDKTKKDLLNKVVKRLIYAFLVYLIPLVISLLINNVDRIIGDKNNPVNTTTSKGWLSCWNDYYTGVKN